MISVCFRVSWKSRVSRSSFLIEISLQISRPSRCHPGSRKANSCCKAKCMKITKPAYYPTSAKWKNHFESSHLLCEKNPPTISLFLHFASLWCRSQPDHGTIGIDYIIFCQYLKFTRRQVHDLSLFLLQINIKTGNGRLNLPR